MYIMDGRTVLLDRVKGWRLGAWYERWLDGAQIVGVRGFGWSLRFFYLGDTAYSEKP